MTNIRRALQAAAGGGADKTYVEDVFSTYLYVGTEATLAIANDIDLDGEGGLVWSKQRTSPSVSFSLIDTARGFYNIQCDTDAAQDSRPTMITAWNSDGYTLGSDGTGTINTTDENYVSWTFRKAPGFFDVVTWTGDNTADRAIPHNLEAPPGMIIVKSTSNAMDWPVYSLLLGSTKSMTLNENYAVGITYDWAQIDPTSTDFYVHNGGNTNYDGYTYVAYLFAHDDQIFGADEDESIIMCGQWTGTGSAGKFVSLGWEPQYLLVKNTDNTDDWWVVDSMRGVATGGSDPYVVPNDDDYEETGSDFISFNATGFTLESGGGRVNESGSKYIYMAIRRPMKVPTAGTEVFNAIARTGTGAEVTVTGAGFPPDLFIGMLRTPAGYWNCLFDRMRGRDKRLVPVSQDAESTITTMVIGFDAMDGVILGTDGGGAVNELGKSYIQWLFHRAPKAFDIVIAPASNPATANAHNLGVAPELSIIRRTVYSSNNWSVATDFTATTMTSKYLNSSGVSGHGLNTLYTANYNLMGAQPTATHFTMIAQSDGPFACYLFATLAGVSKVGSYTADATLTTIDCGFSAAARFILITRVDDTGEWYLYDSVRGIVAGDDPYLLINDTDAEVTDTDYVDPIASGFQLTAAGSTTINIDTAEYIFLAIA